MMLQNLVNKLCHAWYVSAVLLFYITVSNYIYSFSFDKILHPIWISFFGPAGRFYWREVNFKAGISFWLLSIATLLLCSVLKKNAAKRLAIILAFILFSIFSYNTNSYPFRSSLFIMAAALAFFSVYLIEKIMSIIKIKKIRMYLFLIMALAGFFLWIFILYKSFSFYDHHLVVAFFSAIYLIVYLVVFFLKTSSEKWKPLILDN